MKPDDRASEPQRSEPRRSAPARGGGLVDFIVTSDVDEEHLVFLKKLKNNPTVFVNAKGHWPSSFPLSLCVLNCGENGLDRNSSIFLQNLLLSPSFFLILFL